MSDTAPMSFTQDEIGDAFTPWENGRYTAKLLDVQIAPAKNGGEIDSIFAVFTVTSGPKQGEDLRIYRRLAVYRTAKGGWFAPGLQEMKADLVAVNGLEKGQALSRDPAEARKLYAKGLARKEVEIMIYDEIDRKDPSKTYSKKKVVGFAQGAVPAGVEDLDLM